MKSSNPDDLMRPTIVLAISHFERLGHLKFLNDTITEFKNDSRFQPIVFDDNSRGDNKDQIKFIFPNAHEYVLYEQNSGASLMIYKMLVHFYLKTTADYILLLDCDLFLSGSAKDVILKLVQKKVPIVSLYNSFYHARAGIGFKYPVLLAKKKTLGAAGMLIERTLVKTLIDNVPPSAKDYDWHIGDYLLSKKIKMYSTWRSYIQHLGFEGSNNTLKSFDRGNYFFPSTKESNDICKHVNDILGKLPIDPQEKEEFLSTKLPLLLNSKQNFQNKILNSIFNIFD